MQAYLAMTQLTRSVRGASLLQDNEQLDDPSLILPDFAYRLSPEVITQEGAAAWLKVIRLINQIDQERGR